MNDYSQSGQDEWVLSIIKGKGFFVDIGAYDGIRYSNTLKLEEAGWLGLCIEPNPANFEMLIHNRKCDLVNMAVSWYAGTLRMSDEGSSSQIKSSGEISAKCDTLRNIFRDNKVPKYIDYISCDAERMDATIWENFPFDEYSFGLATVEHCLYEGSDDFKKRIMKVMLDNGYVLARENVESDGNPYEDWFINKKLLA